MHRDDRAQPFTNAACGDDVIDGGSETCQAGFARVDLERIAVLAEHNDGDTALSP